MKSARPWLVAASTLFAFAAFAGDLKDQMKVQVETAGAHAGMQPGTYVGAAGHLHVTATVHNLSHVAVGPVKVAGKVFGADGKVLGTATASTRAPALQPNETAPIDLEFLGVTGPLIEQAKNPELTVVSVAPKS